MSRPGYDVILFSDTNTRMWHVPALGPFCIATQLKRHGYTVKIVDYFKNWVDNPNDFQRLVESIVDEQTLFVGFSGLFYSRNGFRDTDKISSYSDFLYATSMTTWPSSDVKSLSEQLGKIKNKFPNVKFVYGGHRNELKFYDLVDTVDYIVKGYAENTVIDLANHLSKNIPIKYRPSGKRAKIIDYDTNASGFDFTNSTVDFGQFDYILPGQVLPIETSRGCLFKCDFCDYPMIGRKKGDPAYHRNIEVLANEFRRNFSQHDTTKYLFYDNIFNESTQKIEDVLRARDLSGVDIKYYAYLRYEILDRFPEQIKLLQELGLQSTMIGIESLNHQSAKSVSKGYHPDRIKSIFHNLKQQWDGSVSVMGSFIIGLPHDTPDNLSWTDWLLSTDCPLDSVHATSFILDASFSNMSPMSAAPEKYGYTPLPNRRWRNQHWDSRQAMAFVKQFMDKAWEQGIYRVGGFDIVGMQNNGYRFDDVYRLPFKDVNYAHTAKVMQQQWKQYRDNTLINSV